MTKSMTSDSEQFVDPLSNYEPVAYRSDLERVLAEDPVIAMNLRPYAMVEPAVSIRQAVHTLHRLKVSSLLVVDQGRLVGIFTERDVLERVADDYTTLANAPVGTVMTCNPLVVYGSDPAVSALAAIAAAGYRHVPVLNGADELIGIVSPRRVFAFLESHFEASFNGEPQAAP